MTIFANSVAGTKWCPLHPEQHCIGDGCPMWRWNEQFELRFITARGEDASRTEFDSEPDRPVGVPGSYVWSPCDGDPAGWVEPYLEANARRMGFCGLAGKPEFA